jgi:hypothetical protein
MSVDDLYRVLHHHWAGDTSIFADERQRVQLAMLLLTAAYTGSRPCSLLDTGKSRSLGGSGESSDDFLDDYYDDSGYDDSDENDDCDGSGAKNNGVDPANLRSILYRHIRMLLLKNPTPGERPILVMEITLVHTKGEDKKPQPYAIHTKLLFARTDVNFFLGRHSYSTKTTIYYFVLLHICWP